LDKNKYHKILLEYIPENAVNYVITLLETNPLHIKITKERSTKHGDFKLQTNGKPMITINYNLNPYAFLITLIHEIAHFVNFKKTKSRVDPHGIEWKTEFKYLMLPLLNNEVFPNDVLSILANHMKNPKASSSSDSKLVQVLKKYNPTNDKVLLHNLDIGTCFILNNMTLLLGDKRRTRFECTDIKNNKKYLVNQNAEVSIVTKE